MRTIAINVTKDDIRNGERSKCGSCPIALAIRRATGDSGALVGVSTVSFSPAFFGAEIPLPYIAQNFITRFDGWMLVEPFSFDIQVND